MLSIIALVALLSASAVSAEEKRQATDKGQFTSAAEQLISQYIPSSALEVLEASVSSAASVGSIAGEPMSLIYDALLAISVPAWFTSAVPSSYSTQIAALEGEIGSLRAGTSSVSGPATIVVTSTGDHGTITTTSTSGVTATSTATTTSTSASGLGGAGSTASSLTTKVVSGVTSVFETAVGGASAVVSGASSVATKASSVVSAAAHAGGGPAGFPTGVAKAAAGFAGFVGMAIAF